MKIGLLVAGPKGAALAEGLLRFYEPEFIVSYRQNGPSCSLSIIKEIAASKGVAFYNRSQFDVAKFDDVDLVFIAGWQYLLQAPASKLVVFHDSLLPKYRGFAPTVAALIAGESEIGVTALRPESAMDSGPILAQRSFAVEYPAKIGAVYSKLAELYLEIGLALISRLPEPIPQIESEATYSLWRDLEDYQIDWSWSCEKIKRFVDAVGAPYGGARTTYEGVQLVVRDVVIEECPNFVDRTPGKVWNIIDNRPSVLTGDGLIRITESEQIDGGDFLFEKIRVRLR